MPKTPRKVLQYKLIKMITAAEGIKGFIKFIASQNITVPTETINTIYELEKILNIHFIKNGGTSFLLMHITSDLESTYTQLFDSTILSKGIERTKKILFTKKDKFDTEFNKLLNESLNDISTNYIPKLENKEKENFEQIIDNEENK
jgi:hypothetical protein